MDEKVIEQKTEVITNLAQEKKAENIVVLDVNGITTLTDTLIICSGNGEIHTRTIGKYVMEETKKMGIPLHHNEGLDNGKWILLDFGDAVLHIFERETRDYYKLEDLWEELIKKRNGRSGTA